MEAYKALAPKSPASKTSLSMIFKNISAILGFAIDKMYMCKHASVNVV